MTLGRYLSRCGFVIAYVLALSLVLRFCARTHPGIYVPTSSFLNAILNGVGLFHMGYIAAIAAGLAHLWQLTAMAHGRLYPVWLPALRILLIAICVTLIAFGLWIAFTLHRLPGMADPPDCCGIGNSAADR